MSEEKTDILRMWSIMSFAVVIFGLGLPLWWKTTQVYRVALPFSEIEELQTLEPRVLVHMSVQAEQWRVRQLQEAFSSSTLFDVQVSANSSELTSVRLVESKQVPSETIVLGNQKSLYFHPSVNTQLVVDVVRKVILRESYLKRMIESLEQPSVQSSQERRIKSEPCFDVVFTTVNPDPDQVSVSFDSEFWMINVIKPLLSQFKPLADFKVKSQWLYFVDFGLEPEKIPGEEGFAIPFNKTPHIISPLEKKLGSGVSRCPCLNFVLYVPRCSEAPLYFRSSQDNLETALVSPKWGGIQIHNPSKENCVNKTFMTPDIASVAKVFVSHLRYLLDLQYEVVPNVQLLPLDHAPLREWEVDSLYRSQILEQAISARLTLQSLSRLLGEISNIVIKEQVGDAIQISVVNIAATFSHLSAGLLQDALGTAKMAYVNAETAFSHPSLLALLYFPDDQKYAVYVPLFLPVIIPVMMSLKPFWRWMKNKEARKVQ